MDSFAETYNGVILPFTRNFSSSMANKDARLALQNERDNHDTVPLTVSVCSESEG